MSVVLVTGGSGFIASYCILQLLAAGHQVGTTVRSLKRESDVRAMLKQPPSLNRTPAGAKPLRAAITCCTWRRRFHSMFPRTRTR